MKAKKYLYLSGLIILTVFVLILGWEFVLEKLIEPLQEHHQRETASDRWIKVFLVTSFTALALIIPAVVLLKVNAKRKQVGKALHESNERLRAVVDSFPAAIFFKDAEGQYTQINQVFRDWYDVKEQVHAGKSPTDYFSEEEAAVYANHDRLVLEEQKVIEVERPVQYPDGKLRSTIIIKFPVLDTTGKSVGIGAINIDNTEKKRSDESLRESEERFRDLIEGSVQGVLIHDGSKSVFANRAYADSFGYPNVEEILAQDSPFDHLMPYERDRIKEYSRIRLNGGDAPMAYEFEGRRKDGSSVWLDNRVRVISWDGKPAVQRTVVDITKRKKAEELHEAALAEAKRANRAKSDFLATMSHELRTPLNAINGFSEMLIGEFFGKLGSPKYMEYAADIRSSSTHLLSLVSDILDLSVIEADEITLNKEYLPVDEIVRDCSRFIIKDAGMRGIQCAVNVATGLPPLLADKRALKQIIINLLSNSSKFTPEGGTISLRAKASNGHHIFEVRDNGVGIPKDMLISLTDPFVRGETDPHKSQEGAGLGLAIAKSLVDLHMGELIIESEIGRGTTVSVSIPSQEMQTD